jgi:hypothetical protein
MQWIVRLLRFQHLGTGQINQFLTYGAMGMVLHAAETAQGQR